MARKEFRLIAGTVDFCQKRLNIWAETHEITVLKLQLNPNTNELVILITVYKLDS